MLSFLSLGRRGVAWLLPCALVLLTIGFAVAAQVSPLSPPTNGPRRLSPTSPDGVGQGRHILVGATVHTSPDAEPVLATIVIQDGWIESIAPTPPASNPASTPASAPASTPGAITHDLTGLHVYAGFIDPFVEIDAPRPDTSAPGAHWNALVTPQRKAMDASRSVNGSWGNPPIDEGTAGTLRSMGFVAAALSPARGIFRGTSAVVSLAQPRSDASARIPPVYRADAYHAVGFDQAGDGGGPGDFRWNQYPDSQMGAIALIRQTLLDADWMLGVRQAHEADGSPLPAQSEAGCLSALADPRALKSRVTEHRPHMNSGLMDVPTGPALWFDTSDELESLRADTIAREFHRALVIVGSGREFRRLDALKAAARPIVVPLAFSQRPRVDTLGYADATPLEDLMMWEQSPTNPRRLAAAGVTFALTTSKIPDKAGGRAAFAPRLALAIKHGLSPKDALAALTTTPAKLLGVERELGTIEKGKRASLIVADGPLFADVPDPEPEAKPARIIDVWIDGERHEILRRPSVPPESLAGTWELTFDPPADAAADAPKPAAKFKAEFVIDDGETPGITIRKTPTQSDEKPATLTTVAREVKLVDNRLTFIFDHTPLGEPGVFTNSAVIEPDRRADAAPAPPAALIMLGEFTRSDGTRMTFTARRTKPGDEKAPDLIGTWKPVPRAGAAVPEACRGLEVIIEKDASPNADPKATTIRAKRAPSLADSRERHYALSSTSAEPDEQGLGSSSGGSGGAGGSGTSIVRYTLVAPEIAAQGDALDGVLAETLIVTLRIRPDAPVTATVRVMPNGADAPPDQNRTAQAAECDIARERRTPERDEIAAIPDALPLPFGPYGRMPRSNVEAGTGDAESANDRLPPRDNLILTNCTIWTCNNKDEVIEDGVIIINGGQISYVGPASNKPGFVGTEAREYRTIDLGRRHVTPGLIDAHSHTGISKGVNEGGQAVTAEVRIGDVTDPDSISWYRQLAGGVTSVNSMHGSANPIGGQTQTNKNRWGVTHPNDMHFEGAKPGIKFALGENVKQSNWGDRFKTRYPQSRMGVETLIRDRFVAAREYARIKPRSHEATKGAMHGGDQNVPGPDRLAARNEAGGAGVSRDSDDAARGTVRADDAAAAGGDLGALQHRRGSRAPIDSGLREVPKDRSRLTGRAFDPDRTRAAGSDAGSNDGADGPVDRDGSGAAGAYPIIGAALASVAVASSERRDEETPSWLRGFVADSSRRDLELDALAEILRGDRLVHCHSYRQDEILMLCRVAQEFDFTIGTFQHGLECYKVAHEVKAAARGASLFTDWWAYKVEVQDAIPSAGPILIDEGVNLSFNSDSDELARRMNHEAAKAVRYSGGPFDDSNAPTSPTISPARALRTVTINPAYQLGIESRVGSIEVGKDADLAVWSHPPTSVYARCERTFIDGRLMFDLEVDLAARAGIARERARLIQKVLAQEARERGTPLAMPTPTEASTATPGAAPGADVVDTKPPSTDLTSGQRSQDQRSTDRRSLLDEMRRQAADARREEYLGLIRRGIDPRFGRCDQCDR